MARSDQRYHYPSLNIIDSVEPIEGITITFWVIFLFVIWVSFMRVLPLNQLIEMQMILNIRPPKTLTAACQKTLSSFLIL